MTTTTLSLDDIDEALRECVKRLRHADADHNRDAVLVYGKQLDRLLAWRFTVQPHPRPRSEAP